MSMRFNNDKLTICEVLRQINDRVQEDKFSDVRDLLALAEQMAKKMSAKLLEYNFNDNPENWYPKMEIFHRLKREDNLYITGNSNRAIELIGKNENSSCTN